MVSFLTVMDIIGPTSSRSGKKTSKALIWLSSAWITESTRGESASLPSSTTSPVLGSTTSLMAKAPSRSASVISTSSTPSFSICWTTEAVIFLPACRISSRLPEASFGPWMERPSFRPTRLLETFQNSLPSLTLMRSHL